MSNQLLRSHLQVNASTVAYLCEYFPRLRFTRWNFTLSMTCTHESDVKASAAQHPMPVSGDTCADEADRLPSHSYKAFKGGPRSGSRTHFPEYAIAASNDFRSFKRRAATAYARTIVRGTTASKAGENGTIHTGSKTPPCGRNRSTILPVPLSPSVC